MNDVSLIRVDTKTCSLEMLQQWARCYCDIWKDPPWNEDFWQPEEVVRDFQNLMLKPDATAFLAVQNDVVAGFTLGYSVNREELQVIAGNNLMDHLFEKNNRIFYVGELGVATQYRGRRISFALTSSLMQAVRSSGLKSIVLRTHVKAHVARHVYEKIAFSELDVRDAKFPDRTYWLLEVNHE